MLVDLLAAYDRVGEWVSIQNSWNYFIVLHYIH